MHPTQPLRLSFWTLRLQLRRHSLRQGIQGASANFLLCFLTKNHLQQREMSHIVRSRGLDFASSLSFEASWGRLRVTRVGDLTSCRPWHFEVDFASLEMEDLSSIRRFACQFSSFTFSFLLICFNFDYRCSRMCDGGPIVFFSIFAQRVSLPSSFCNLVPTWPTKSSCRWQLKGRSGHCCPRKLCRWRRMRWAISIFSKESFTVSYCLTFCACLQVIIPEFRIYFLFTRCI